MGSPAVRLLKPGTGAEGQPGGAFALCGRPGWRTRVYASPDRDAIVRALQGAASKKLAIQLAGMLPAALCLGKHETAGGCACQQDSRKLHCGSRWIWQLEIALCLAVSSKMRVTLGACAQSTRGRR